MLLLVLTVGFNIIRININIPDGVFSIFKMFRIVAGTTKCSVSVVIIIHFVEPSILLLPKLFLMESLARVEVTQLTPAPTCKA